MSSQSRFSGPAASWHFSQTGSLVGARAVSKRAAPPAPHTHLVFRSVPRDGGRRGTWQSRAKLWPPWNLDDECVATDFNNKIKFVCLFSCEIKFPLTKLFPILILAS